MQTEFQIIQTNKLSNYQKIKIMKKNVFFLAVLLCVITFFVSCSKQEEFSYQRNNEVPKDKQEMKQLIIALAEYNTNYQKIHGVTRSFRGWFKKLLRVTYADAVGAILGSNFGPWGAIAGGVSASALVYCEEENLPSQFSFAPTRSYLDGNNPLPVLTDGDGNINLGALSNVVLDSNIPACTDSVGFYHNKILLYLNAHNLLHINNNNTDSLTNAICEHAEEISSNGRGTTTNTELLQQLKFSQFKLAYPSMAMLETFDEYVDEYVVLYPELDDYLWFLWEYISTLCDIDPEDNDGTYAEGVLEIIGESQVSNTVKKRLGEAVITGYASSRLWNFED